RTTAPHTAALPLHDALPIYQGRGARQHNQYRGDEREPSRITPQRNGSKRHGRSGNDPGTNSGGQVWRWRIRISRAELAKRPLQVDRKSTRLNSSHVASSYAV